MDWKQARKRLRCDCSVHDVVSRVVEYFIITPIFACAYLAVTIPWMVFIIGLDSDQFYNFVTQSIMIDLVVAYPVAKLVLKLKPKIDKLTRLSH